jgi:DNA-binding CsgD family transcriptional regulator
VDRVVRACYEAGGDLAELRRRLLEAVNKVVPFDAAFFSTVDPDTFLFTTVYADEALVESAPLFMDSEFGAEPDFNRFADLARSAQPAASLDSLTGGDRAASARWRDVIDPLGMGDEARVALRVDGTTWGFLCLHRSGPTGFSASELATLSRVAPHAGEAIRRIVSGAVGTEAGDAVVLVVGGSIVAVGGATSLAPGDELPVALTSVVRRLEAIEAGVELDLPAAVRVTTESGALVSVHAARMRDGSSGPGPVAITIAPATPDDRSSLLLAAHGLTPAQRRVAALVLQGRTTAQIVIDLRITANTVQDHLKVIFDKFGVRSRRDLVAALMRPTPA